LNQNFNDITYKLKQLADDVENMRKKYYEEKQSHNNTKRLLNYLMRDLREYKIPSKFYMDMTLMLDCVMIKPNATENGELELFYSLDELEEKMKEYSSLNSYDCMVSKLEVLKELYSEEEK